MIFVWGFVLQPSHFATRFLLTLQMPQITISHEVSLQLHYNRSNIFPNYLFSVSSEIFCIELFPQQDRNFYGCGYLKQQKVLRHFVASDNKIALLSSIQLTVVITLFTFHFNVNFMDISKYKYKAKYKIEDMKKEYIFI